MEVEEADEDGEGAREEEEGKECSARTTVRRNRIYHNGLAAVTLGWLLPRAHNVRLTRLARRAPRRRASRVEERARRKARIVRKWRAFRVVELHSASF